MDYDDVANISDTPSNDDISPSMSAQQITHEIIFALFCILGIVADSLIMYTILKFQRLRTVKNLFIVNWAIADLLSLFLTPSAYRIVSVIENIGLSRKFMCILITVGSVLHLTVMLFVIVVCINWALEAFFRRGHEFVKKHYRIVIGVVWMIGLGITSINSGLCLNNSYHFSIFVHISLLLTVMGTFLLILGLHISRGVQKCRRRPLDNSPFMLNLATAFIACWFLDLIGGVFVGYVGFHHALLLLAQSLIFSSSFINLSLLYFYNQDFQACLRQVLTCTNNKYHESSLDFENPIIRAQNRNSTTVQVSFNNPNGELLTNEY